MHNNNSFLNNFNFFLINNLNKFHPFIFYFSVFNFLTNLFVFMLVYKFDKIFFKKEIFFNLFNKNIYTTAFLNVWALCLGGWWAFQEGSWGGWWNWDPSESFGLLILIFSVLLSHYKQDITQFEFFKMFTFLWVIFFSLVYYFIQLNFDLVSHNFGIKFFFFFNNSLFLLESILIGSFMLFSLLFIFSKKFNIYIFFINYSKNFNVRHFYLYFYIFLFSLVLTKIILSSFSLLISYFLWTFFNVNFLNYEMFLKNYFYFVINLFLLFIFKFKILCLSGILVFLTFLPLFYLFFDIKNSLFNLLHIILFFFLIINLISTNFNFINDNLIKSYVYENFLNFFLITDEFWLLDNLCINFFYTILTNLTSHQYPFFFYLEENFSQPLFYFLTFINNLISCFFFDNFKISQVLSMNFVFENFLLVLFVIIFFIIKVSSWKNCRLFH